jgi:hypothetical protein
MSDPNPAQVRPCVRAVGAPGTDSAGLQSTFISCAWGSVDVTCAACRAPDAMGTSSVYTASPEAWSSPPSCGQAQMTRRGGGGRAGGGGVVVRSVGGMCPRQAGLKASKLSQLEPDSQCASAIKHRYKELLHEGCRVECKPRTQPALLTLSVGQ